jgi:formylglycine-generating enzyme required for sulfatase activity
MPLLPGEILNQRYRIINLMAAGSYGATYRAYDIKDERHYAIKEYLDASPEIQKRFRAEARSLTQLSHPQLATFRDHFALEGVGQYLVSDYVDGVDLQSLIDQYGPLPSDLIIGWLQSACEPLAYLHKRGVLHLNIKPANLRLTADATIFLVDTGLPGLGVRPHTDGYGAPEQQAQTEVTGHSDIYSLGATLYTLLTAQVPPKALSRESGLADLIPAREVNPDVEPYLSLVAARAMSIRADARYESANDFAQALNRPLGHPTPLKTKALRRTAVPTTPAAPPPILPPARRKQMEQRTIWGLTAVLLLLIVTIAALTLASLNPPETEVEAGATATLESVVIAALTAIAPTPTPLPPPTEPPTPSPEPIITNTGARMLFMPGGIFRLGNDEGENDEKPSQLVRVDAFYIDETEVTNVQYAQCVEAGTCAPPRSSAATYHERYYGDPAFDDYPVIFVTWYDAQTFCEWRDGRLPSEAEWEKAASYDPAQSLKLRYPWGDAFDGTKLNFCDANCPAERRDGAFDDGHRDTAPVGSYGDGRSPSGLYDMSGNAMEWVNDWYDPRTYRNVSDTNPLGPAEGEFKSIRGGSWLSDMADVSATARTSFDPTVARANLGFRCAADVP